MYKHDGEILEVKVYTQVGRCNIILHDQCIYGIAYT